MHTQDWSVRIMIEEDDDHTHARAVLTSRDGVSLHGDGNADRKPGDAPIPEIGEQLAAARALYALADHSWTPPPMTSRTSRTRSDHAQVFADLMNGSTAPVKAGQAPVGPAVSACARPATGEGVHA